MEATSASQPMSMGMMAPPTMAITMKAEALLVCGPSPWMPSAKMVGNMIDMKKKLAKSAPTEIQPSGAITKTMTSTLTAAKSASVFSALNQLKARLPVKRPSRNSPKPPKESSRDAARSVIWKPSALA